MSIITNGKFEIHHCICWYRMKSSMIVFSLRAHYMHPY